MKHILLSVIVISALIVAGVGGTFAHFSDTETVADNQLTAGTLDLKVSVDGGTTWGDEELLTPFAKDPINPSEWYKVEEEWLHNAGNKPGELCLHITVTEVGEGVTPEPELTLADELGIPNPNDIDKHMDIIIIYCWPDNMLHTVTDAANWEEAVIALELAGLTDEIIYAGKLDGVHCVQKQLDDYMEPCEKSLLQILMHLQQGTAGTVTDANLYQGDFVKFTKEFKLIEVPVKPVL